MQQLQKVAVDINTKLENQDFTVEEKLKLMKQNLLEFEYKMKRKAEVEQVSKIRAEAHQLRMNVDQQI